MWTGIVLLIAVTALYSGYNLLVKVSSNYVPESATSTVLATICLQLAALAASCTFAFALLAHGGHVLKLSASTYAWAAGSGPVHRPRGDRVLLSVPRCRRDRSGGGERRGADHRDRDRGAHDAVLVLRAEGVARRDAGCGHGGRGHRHRDDLLRRIPALSRSNRALRCGGGPERRAMSSPCAYDSYRKFRASGSGRREQCARSRSDGTEWLAPAAEAGQP